MSPGNVSRALRSRRVLPAKPVPQAQGRAAVIRLASECAVFGCHARPEGGTLRDRRWCAGHLAEMIRDGASVAVGCGCVVPCEDCSAFAASGKTVILVGERYNLGGEEWGPHDKEADFRYLLRLGAFRVGISRARLIASGVRWDFALNLLRPARPGSWEPRRAREVAEAIRADLLREAELVVLLGVRVRDAFGFAGGPGPRRLDDRFLLLPHPSGRSMYWNGGQEASSLVRTTFREALGAPAPVEDES